MKNIELTDKEKKIIKGLGKAYKKLVAYKKKMNYELVVYRDGKIVKEVPK